tara:strand:+ start:80 stop:535 length:456 start_codon:yes stop_codon:yes gene_type:complete
MEINNYPDYTIYPDGTILNHKLFVIKMSWKDKDGYIITNLSNKDGKKCKKLHRLLAEHFIPNPDNLPLVDHIDRNPSNNSLDNLRWVSLSGNCQNRLDSEIHIIDYIHKGKIRYHFSKMIDRKSYQCASYDKKKVEKYIEEVYIKDIIKNE